MWLEHLLFGACLDAKSLVWGCIWLLRVLSVLVIYGDAPPVTGAGGLLSALPESPGKIFDNIERIENEVERRKQIVCIYMEL